MNKLIPLIHIFLDLYNYKSYDLEIHKTFMCPSFIEDVHKQPCHMDNCVEGEDPSTQKEAEQHEEQDLLACNVDLYMLFSIDF